MITDSSGINKSKRDGSAVNNGVEGDENTVYFSAVLEYGKPSFDRPLLGFGGLDGLVTRNLS